ncbi:hypothetical protein [Aeromonas cavernicola]|uniref:Uncharacterized protein n=1 Tax=Aeromonas cavernicola TaxID=1006623 RepID=A0A2H9U3V6_9GAMM|nr:hypothetical protein [Aeromonas cavernicola]PJG58659.1 hypothetical protein CUC53_11500 [Aeromonas cavernicola]
MFTHLPFWLFPLTGLMAFGALVILALVLWRGDLCPGQRARITTGLFSVWVIGGLSLMLAIEANAANWLIGCATAALILGISLSLIQSRLAGKRALSVHLLWLPALPLAVYVVGLLQTQGWVSGSLQAVILGAAFAHLILLRARHRLQAFNLLLPVAALVATVVSLLWLALQVVWQSHLVGLDVLIPGVVTQAILLIAALLLWFSPLYLHKETAPVVVSTSLCGLLIAQIAATSVLQQLT